MYKNMCENMTNLKKIFFTNVGNEIKDFKTEMVVDEIVVYHHAQRYYQVEPFNFRLLDRTLQH